MYHLTFDTVPTIENDEFSTLDGAIVVAWIPSEDAIDLDDAERLARAHIEKHQWFIKSLDEASIIDEEIYEPHDEHREFFETALSGEQEFVFYTFPDSD